MTKDSGLSKCKRAIHCELPILAFLQHRLIETFPSRTFRYCKYFVTDINGRTDQTEIIATEQNRAHHAAQENVKQILHDYLFPKMSCLAAEVALNCKTCSKAKYKRHAVKKTLGRTPIPSYAR